MTPRKKAGPNIGSHLEVQLIDNHWEQFINAIGVKASSANRIILPGGWTVREGLRWAIRFVLGVESGPTSRETIADLKRFMDQIRNAYFGMLPETRELFDEQYAGAKNLPDDISVTTNRVLEQISEIEDDEHRHKRDSSLEHFLSDVIFLIEQLPNVSPSFPSKAYYHLADNYAVYRGSRAAVKIALELAEVHAKSAVKKLERLHECKQSTFVNKLFRARHGVSYLSVVSGMPL